MNNFSQFNIKPQSKGFEGDKIKIDRVQNKSIVVLDYKIDQSKYEKGNGKCLTMQIIVDNTKRVLFTGSVTLMEMIQQVRPEQMPFQTIIVKDNDRLKFS